VCESHTFAEYVYVMFLLKKNSIYVYLFLKIFHRRKRRRGLLLTRFYQRILQVNVKNVETDDMRLLTSFAARRRLEI